MPPGKTLVLGVGNLLLSDEGFGVHVIHRITADPRLPSGVDVLDGRTLGPRLLDAILELYIEHPLSPADILARGYDETTVRWIQRRVDLNEWKRHQAAPGLRVTSKAFGIGRRVPIVQQFFG